MVDFCSEKREKREMFAKKMGSQLTAVMNPLNNNTYDLFKKSTKS